MVEYKKATIAGNAYSFKVSVKATEVESDSNVIVNSTWTSVDQNIATVSRAKSTDNGNIITVKKGVEGETMISVTVRNNEAAKTEQDRKLYRACGRRNSETGGYEGDRKYPV